MARSEPAGLRFVGGGAAVLLGRAFSEAVGHPAIALHLSVAFGFPSLFCRSVFSQCGSFAHENSVLGNRAKLPSRMLPDLLEREGHTADC